MSQRAGRVTRLIALRDRQLQQETGRLHQHRQRETQASQQVTQANELVQKALTDRRNLAEHSVDALTYLQAEDWLLSLQAKQAIAAQQLQRARLVVAQSTASVQRARTKVEQLKKLQQTIEKREEREQAISDRKLDDEISQQAFRRRR